MSTKYCLLSLTLSVTLVLCFMHSEYETASSSGFIGSEIAWATESVGKYRIVDVRNEMKNGKDAFTVISSALKSAVPGNPVQLTFTSGEYLLSAQFKLPSGTRMLLSKDAVLKLQPGKWDYFIGIDRSTDIEISGGSIEVPQGSKGERFIAVIYGWNDPKLINIHDITIKAPQSHGIFMNGASEVSIQRVLVPDPGKIGIGFFRGSGNISVVGTKVTRATMNGLEVSGKNSQERYNVSITDCEIKATGDNGIALTNIGGGLIKANYIFGGRAHAGITCRDCNNLVIANNIIYDNFDGILLNYNSSNNQVVDNEIYGNVQDGIDIAYGDGKNNSILRNTLRDNGIWGLYLIDTKDNKIRDNRIINNSKLAHSKNTNTAGIQLDKGSNGNVIKDNTIHAFDNNSSEYAIFEGDKSGNNIISGNNLIGKIRRKNK